nr:uncharacterized protein LOC129267110 [Lytechinus pictus]
MSKVIAKGEVGGAKLSPDVIVGWDSASHNNVYSSDPLPCTFKGEMYFHADSWIIDRDTECHCNDSDVICDVMTCPYLDCDSPIPIPKEPCPICFHNVIVQLLNVKLHPLNDVMTAYVPVTLTFDIDVLFEEFSQTTSVTGKRLWKVSAWGSSEPDGGGAWHGYVDQVLTARQSSKSHKRDTDFVIDEINFDLVPPSCEAVRYICVSFARGDAPVTKTQLELIFTGTDDEKKDVRKCVRAPRCDEPVPLPPKSIMGQTCRSGGREYLPGEEWKKSACVSCVCEDGQANCETERCLRSNCANPVQVEGVCCRVCPYMSLNDLSSKSKDVERGTVQANIYITGTMSSRAFVDPKATVDEAIQAVKEDLLRTVHARFDLLASDLRQSSGDEELKETQIAPPTVIATPRRIYARLRTSPILVSDYAFAEEQAGEIADRMAELLDVEVSEEDLDLDTEALPDESLLNPTDSGVDEDEGELNVSTRSSKSLQYMGAAAVGLLGAAVAGAMSYLAITQD